MQYKPRNDKQNGMRRAIYNKPWTINMFSNNTVALVSGALIKEFPTNSYSSIRFSYKEKNMSLFRSPLIGWWLQAMVRNWNNEEQLLGCLQGKHEMVQKYFVVNSYELNHFRELNKMTKKFRFWVRW